MSPESPFTQKNNQNKQSPQAEFREAATPREFLDAYKKRIGEVTVAHATRLGGVADDHSQAFEAERAKPGTIDVSLVLSRTTEGLQQSIETIVPDLDAILGAAAATVDSSLGERLSTVLKEARSKAATFGPQSPFVDRALQAASSPEVRAAMKASLDELVLKEARSKAATFGPQSPFVDRALQAASSPEVRAAMKASLDELVLKEARSKAATFGPQSPFVDRALQAASSPEVRAAMKASLDELVLKEARSKAATFGPQSPFVDRALQAASSPEVFVVFCYQMNVPTSHSSYERTNGGSSDQFGADSSFIGGGFRRARQQQGQRDSYDHLGVPRQNTAPKAGPSGERTVEINNIITEIIKRNKRYSWLRNESPQDILRIVNTVRALRKKAADNDTTISDRKIYLQYRAKSETDPQFTKSVQIFEALMSGDLKGSLPF